MVQLVKSNRAKNIPVLSGRLVHVSTWITDSRTRKLKHWSSKDILILPKVELVYVSYLIEFFETFLESKKVLAVLGCVTNLKVCWCHVPTGKLETAKANSLERFKFTWSTGTIH